MTIGLSQDFGTNEKKLYLQLLIFFSRDNRQTGTHKDENVKPKPNDAHSLPQ